MENYFFGGWSRGYDRWKYEEPFMSAGLIAEFCFSKFANIVNNKKSIILMDWELFFILSGVIENRHESFYWKLHVKKNKTCPARSIGDGRLNFQTIHQYDDAISVISTLWVKCICRIKAAFSYSWVGPGFSCR